ncbi:MAG: DUF1688 family protein [Betaproteobacteria bacterium]
MGSSDAAVAEPAERPHLLAALHDPATIRLRCASVMRAVEANLSPSFRLDREALPALAERVARLTRERFPTLDIPFHSRWRHFEAGGVDRKAEMDAALAGQDRLGVARARFDLAVVSVLLDAGAGAQWTYTEGQALGTAARPRAAADELLAMLDQAATTAAASPAPPAEPPVPAGGRRYTRSEGLGVASFRAFMAGAFSSRAGEPLRADAGALRHIDAAALRAVFQSSPDNPVVGLEGRAALLARLGAVLAEEAGRDAALGRPTEARPALLFDRVTDFGRCASVDATELLGEVLRTLGPIWPRGARIKGVAAGDVGAHRWAGDALPGGGHDPTTGGWVPFHKLSQWMTYSLLEPLQWAGIGVTGLGGEHGLTGLPEYRNGGLFIDGGVIVPRSPWLLERTHKPEDETIVEWRALTVCLLDELAVLVRGQLGRDEQTLPLACVLEGGTWAAGRALAAERRPGGAPPLKVESDGTVF